MKLTRGINKQELEELIKTGRVLPKRYSKICFNNPSPIQITLNMLRSNLDWDDYLYAPNGYTINDVRYCEYNGYKGKVKDIWEHNFQK